MISIIRRTATIACGKHIMYRLFLAASILLTFFCHAVGCTSSVNTAASSSFLDFSSAIAIVHEVSLAAHQYRKATGSWPDQPHQLIGLVQSGDTLFLKWLQFEETPDSDLVVHIAADSGFVPGDRPLRGWAKTSGQTSTGVSVVDIHLNFEDGGFLQGKMRYAGTEPAEVTIEAATIYPDRNLDRNEKIEPVSLTEEDLELLEEHFGIRVKEE